LDGNGRRGEPYCPFDSDGVSYWSAEELFSDGDLYEFPEDEERELVEVVVDAKPHGDETLVTVTGIYEEGEDDSREYITNLPV
jgi:hypothetical protein